MKITKIENLYPAIEKLISDLRSNGQTQLADILNHRMHEVAWTTGSELLEELTKILSQALRDSNLSQSLNAQIKQIIFVVNDWFKKTWGKNIGIKS